MLSRRRRGGGSSAGAGGRCARAGGPRDRSIGSAVIAFPIRGGMIERGLRQLVERLIRVGWIHVREIAGPHPGQRVERQPKAHRRVAGDEVAALAAQQPGPALPGRPLGALGDRQNVSDGLIERAVQNAREALPLQRVGERRARRIDVGGKLALAPQVIEGVFERPEHMVPIDAETARHFEQQPRRVPGGAGIIARFIRDERRVAPHRLSVPAPETVERPARQRFAGIPFSLAEVGEAPKAHSALSAACTIGRQ